MISPILPSHDADTIGLELGIFIARQSHHYRVSRDAVIAAIREALPSQPPSQAPVATTPTTAPVDVQAEGDDASASADPLPESASRRVDDLGSVQDARKMSSDGQPAEGLGNSDGRKPGEEQAGLTGGESAATPSQPQPIAGKSGEPPETKSAAPKRVTVADKIRAHIADHPDATARDVADATGIKISSVTWAASTAGITLRKMTPEEHAEATRRGDAGRRVPVSTRTEPQDDATDVLHRVKRAPQGRFYLRDKATGLFVHQSLQPCPTGPGPLMTFDRKWAWYDTVDRYRGAKKKWPELASMRKEAASK